METPVEQRDTGPGAPVAADPPRRGAIFLTTAIVGPAIGGLLFVLFFSTVILVRGTVSVDKAVVGVPVTYVFAAPLSYLVAWQPAILAGAINALLLPFVSRLATRIAVAMLTGFATTFVLMPLRPRMDWFLTIAWQTDFTLTVCTIGAVSSAVCIWLVDHFSRLRAKRTA